MKCSPFMSKINSSERIRTHEIQSIIWRTSDPKPNTHESRKKEVNGFCEWVVVRYSVTALIGTSTSSESKIKHDENIYFISLHMSVAVADETPQTHCALDSECVASHTHDVRCIIRRTDDYQQTRWHQHGDNCHINKLTGNQVNTGNDYRINLFVKLPREYKIASTILPTDRIQKHKPKSDPQL